jgi:hypothetical protein
VAVALSSSVVVGVMPGSAHPAMAAPPAVPPSTPPPPAPPRPLSPPSLSASPSASAASAATAPAAPAAGAPPIGAAPQPAATPPAPETTAAGDQSPPGPAAPQEQERHLPVLDATAAESDHDAVRDAWGVEVRPVVTTLSTFALRASTGCPMATATSAAGACSPVTVSALAVRRWVGRNVAWNGGLAFAAGGGSDGGRLLDTYFGAGPVVGMSILLANWRHLAVAASPELAVVVFKGAGSASTAYLADLKADVEAELHFGFIGAPALSLGIRSGLVFRFEHASDATIWSIGVGGATTVRSLYQDLALRYYF